jgi:hypothetical protein
LLFKIHGKNEFGSSFCKVFECILTLVLGWWTASIAAYFITADKTILECARKNAQLEDSLRHSRNSVSS